MNEPPQSPDPFGTTQSIPIVTPQPQPQPQPQASVPAASGAVPYVHAFGNVPFYLLTRFAAFVVDVFLVAYLIATFGFHAFEAGYLAYGSRSEGGFLSLVLSSLAIAFTFAFLCEALTGTTIGKALFALHTRAVDGRHAGGGRVFVRYLLRPIDLLLIGPLLALVTPKHRRLGDFAGGTVVSRSRFGPIAPIVGILLLAGLAYAQIAYGGGLTSAIEVGAEASNFGPDLIGKAAHGVGLSGVPLPAVPVPLPSPSPSDATGSFATDSPATPSPAASDEAPAVEPSSDAATDAPDGAQSPSDDSTDEPQATAAPESPRNS
jgi:uncharacterized RDD family membrane protein YckC